MKEEVNHAKAGHDQIEKIFKAVIGGKSHYVYIKKINMTSFQK